MTTRQRLDNMLILLIAVGPFLLFAHVFDWMVGFLANGDFDPRHGIR